MRPGSIALGLAAAAVAVGGIYLYLSLRDAASSPTPEQALAAARAETEAAAAPPAVDRQRPERERPERERVRPAIPLRRPPGDDGAERGGIPGPQTDLRKGAGDAPNLDSLPTKFRADLVDPKAEVASAEQSDTLLEANKLYDKGDFEGARSLAQKLLVEMPGNVRMLRVVVSSSCIMGEGDVAQKYASQLPQADREAMAQRCSKFQIDLK